MGMNYYAPAIDWDVVLFGLLVFAMLFTIQRAAYRSAKFLEQINAKLDKLDVVNHNLVGINKQVKEQEERRMHGDMAPRREV
jgi:uncharacterized membrane protein